MAARKARRHKFAKKGGATTIEVDMVEAAGVVTEVRKGMITRLAPIA